MYRARRHGIVTISLVLSVLGLVFLMALSGYFQVSSSRASLERIYGRRELEIVMNSAVEEICARLEGLPRCRKIPLPSAVRDLRDTVSLPSSARAPLAESDAKEQGVELGEVRLRSSSWKCEIDPDSAGNAMVRERALLEFTVPLTANVGSTRLKQTFTVARYAEMSPDMGQSEARLRFQHNNILVRVE